MSEDIMDRFSRIDNDEDVYDPTKDKGNWESNYDDMDSEDWENHFGKSEDPSDGEPPEWEKE